jgi:hypothetical protein
MLRGFGQRAAVAITLMGVLLLSVGVCVLPAQHAAHGCCSHMGVPCESLNANCCAAGPQIPAAVVSPVFAGLASIDLAPVFQPAIDRSLPNELVIARIAPSLSPPTVIFSLRI